MTRRRITWRALFLALLASLSMFAIGTPAQADTTPAAIPGNSLFRVTTTWEATVFTANGGQVSTEDVKLTTVCAGFYFATSPNGQFAYGATDPSCVDNAYTRRQLGLVRPNTWTPEVKVTSTVKVPTGGNGSKDVVASVNNGGTLAGTASILTVEVPKAYVSSLPLQSDALRNDAQGTPIRVAEALESASLPANLVNGTIGNPTRDEANRPIEYSTDIPAVDSIGAPVVSDDGKVLGVVNSHITAGQTTFTSVEGLLRVAKANGLLEDEPAQPRESTFTFGELLTIVIFLAFLILLVVVMIIVTMVLRARAERLTMQNSHKAVSAKEQREHELTVLRLTHAHEANLAQTEDGTRRHEANAKKDAAIASADRPGPRIEATVNVNDARRRTASEPSGTNHAHTGSRG